MKNLDSAQGCYLNYFDKYNPELFDLFVIFNEGWGNPEDVIKIVDEAISNYLDTLDLKDCKLSDTEIELAIMDVFDKTVESFGNWGCQVYMRSRR